jgi:hypothetical protein
LRSCEGDARATLFIALPALVGNLITNATTTGSFDAEKIGLSRLALPISHHAPEMTGGIARCKINK